MKENNKQKSIQEICDDLFLSGEEQYRGKIGVKDLGSIMGLSDSEFESYIESLKGKNT